MARVRINYSRIISQVNNITELADDYEREIRKLDQMEQSVKMNWEGPAATAFLIQSNYLREEMYKNYQRMLKVSETIRNVASRIKREDEEVAERAKQLNRT